MRPPRLKIRTLMVLVALFAIVIWSGVEVTRLWRLSRYYRATAAAMRAKESENLQISRIMDGAVLDLQKQIADFDSAPPAWESVAPDPWPPK